LCRHAAQNSWGLLAAISQLQASCRSLAQNRYRPLWIGQRTPVAVDLLPGPSRSPWQADSQAAARNSRSGCSQNRAAVRSAGTRITSSTICQCCLEGHGSRPRSLNNKQRIRFRPTYIVESAVN
jgi:hypothetical protein